MKNEFKKLGSFAAQDRKKFASDLNIIKNELQELINFKMKEIENADETWKAILSRFPEFRNLGLEDIEDFIEHDLGLEVAKIFPVAALSALGALVTTASA